MGCFMGTIRFYDKDRERRKEERINVFNSYKNKYINICETLKQLSVDGYNEHYFKEGFLNYLIFIDFFEINLEDFESANWRKWSYPDVKKSNIFKEEDIEKMRNYFKPLDRR